MDNFPNFIRADGSQMAFWTCSETASSAKNIDDFDEFMLVLEGCYSLLIKEDCIRVKAGEGYVIPRGMPHSGEVLAGRRTIHAFAGHRVDRVRAI